MDPHSIGWDAVEARFRELGKMKSFSSMVARMLHLVSVLRDEPQLVHCARWVSHVSVVLSDADRHVSIAWSEPGGMAWAGEQGFVVIRVGFDTMTSSEHVVVEEDGVVAAVLERLGLTRA